MKWDPSEVRTHPYEAAHYIQKLEYAAKKVVEALESQEIYRISAAINDLNSILTHGNQA